jgi:hypothetical protein
MSERYGHGHGSRSRRWHIIYHALIAGTYAVHLVIVHFLTPHLHGAVDPLGDFGDVRLCSDDGTGVPIEANLALV